MSQTPQFFDYKILYNANLHNKKNLDNFTDDAQIFAKSNSIVHTISGDINNIKITTNKDWINKKKML